MLLSMQVLKPEINLNMFHSTADLTLFVYI